jgi:hypothetical protein
VADAAALTAQHGDLCRLEGPGARILVVASEWLSWHGDLSTFSRELCAALAATGQQVLCLVPAANVEELADAASRGVGLLSATAELYAEDAVRLRRRPLLGGLEPQIVIGHGRVTGPQARSLRDDFFPDAARVHVIDTYGGHIEWFKQPGPHETRTQKAAERADHERFLAEGADVVAAVGSLLTREAQTLLGRNVVELIPGVGALADVDAAAVSKLGGNAQRPVGPPESLRTRAISPAGRSSTTGLRTSPGYLLGMAFP